MTHPLRERLSAVAMGVALAASLACAQTAGAHDDQDRDHDRGHDHDHDHDRDRTATPIKHVIIVVGENHTFDNLFGTYKPRAGQYVDNLLSKGIVNADGSPGPNFSRGQQLIGTDTDGYHAVTASTGSYDPLPVPYTTYGIGLPQGVPDTRFPANLPNGPYQISTYVPYAAYTGDPV